MLFYSTLRKHKIKRGLFYYIFKTVMHTASDAVCGFLFNIMMHWVRA